MALQNLWQRKTRISLFSDFLFLHIGILLQNSTLPSSYLRAPINCWSEEFLNPLVSIASVVAVYIRIEYQQLFFKI